MGRFTTAKYVVAASALLPFAAVWIWPAQHWIVAAFALWLTAAAAYWIAAERKESRTRLERAVRSVQSASVRTLNHHRHDWMNDLQVLYGYIRLGKLDKTVQYVENIRERMAAESAISKLGVPSLISYIQSFRTLTHALQLEVTVKGELNLSELALDGERIAETIVDTINAYRFSVKAASGHVAVLRLVLEADEEALYASFYYEGELMNERQWKQKIQQQLEGAPLQPVGTGHSFAEVLLKADMRA